MSKPFPLYPGLALEWRHTPDWTVCSRMIVDSIEDGYVWIHFDDERATKNRLRIEAVYENGRPAPKRDAFDRFAAWLADKFGPEAQGAFWRSFVLESVFSRWDLLLGFAAVALYVGVEAGKRPAWAFVPLFVVWFVGHVWAAFSQGRYERTRPGPRP